jgi:archaemetzincin
MSGPYSDLDLRLRSLADPMPVPRAGDWLAEHEEPGQTFEQFVDSDPVRKSDKLTTIYVCQLGDFSDAQQRIINLTREYPGVFFEAQVIVHRRMPMASIPTRAKRTHPARGDRQVLTTYVLRNVLEPDRPGDALAYLALTASDLWPGKGWNFVFGQANLRRRVGIWSIYRNGDPEADFQLFLRRTIGTASHETGHILGMKHCTLCLPDEWEQPPRGEGQSANAPLPGLPAEVVLESTSGDGVLPWKAEGDLSPPRTR